MTDDPAAGSASTALGLKVPGTLVTTLEEELLLRPTSDASFGPPRSCRPPGGATTGRGEHATSEVGQDAEGVHVCPELGRLQRPIPRRARRVELHLVRPPGNRWCDGRAEGPQSPEMAAMAASTVG